MASNDQEFTFPIISGDTCPSTIDSPPLWRLSPAASPDPYRERRGEGEGEGYCGYEARPNGYNKQRKSCSDIENDDDDEEGEEKMDVLWEDFNEELYGGKSRLESCNNKSSSSRDTVELGCVQALKLSSKTGNNNGAIFPSSSTTTKNGNKPGMVVFIKVLKRLFLLHNSHHHHHHQHHQHKHHHHHHHKSVTVKNMKW